MQVQSQADPFKFLGSSGEVAAIARSFDWSSTPLGKVEGWSPNLKSAVSLLFQSPIPIVLLWGEDGVMIYNDAYSGFAGHRHPALFGSEVREGWAEIADFNNNVMKVGLAGGTLSYRDQELTLHRNGVPEQVWMDLAYYPVLDENGSPAGVMAIVVETTERVLAERHQRVLINELNHRVKNTLASIQSIATQTLRGGQTKEQASVSIGDRILALSRAHNVLTDENWDGADLQVMAESSLEAFQQPGRTAICMDGPPLRLGPHAALSIALALHELAANAVKYGSLSSAAGTVDIVWTVDSDGRFDLVWTERGGPPVVEGDRHGFGSRLILQILPLELRGTTSIDYAHSGAVFRLVSSFEAITDRPAGSGH